MPIGQGAVAFVPEPMPTTVSLDAPTQRLLSEADYALGRLAGAAGRVVNPYLIGQPLAHEILAFVGAPRTHG